ncbi:MAG TPA: transposase [Puia sp.]|nr:transposase [Puia sp.]
MLTNQVEEYPCQKRRWKHFSKTFILKIVKQVERGVSRSELVEKHKMAKSTLADWMRDYGSPSYHQGKQKRFSAEHKTSVLRAVVDGQMTVREAMMAYRVTSTTIKAWVRSYKLEKGELASIMARKNSPNKEKLGQTYNKELEATKKALEEAQLKIQALNTLIDVAEDNFKISIRKKAGAKRS